MMCSVVLCAALSMGQQAEVPWTGVFERLDLQRPGLEAVRAAVEAGDERAAAEALVGYYLARRDAGYAPRAEPDEGYDRAPAEKVLAREYGFLGKPFTLTRDIDWNANPVHDHEWPIELNRHRDWQTLARAWSATGDARYAEDLAFQIRDWLADNPRPGSTRDARYTWRTLECGLRLQDPWPESFFRMLGAPGFTPELACAMLLALWEQCDYLAASTAGGNWLTMEKNGLLTIALTFTEFTDCPAWQAHALDAMSREIGQQVYPDGAQFELTPHYHAVAMRNFDAVYQLAEAHGLALPEAYARGLESMHAYLACIAKPSGRVPMWNDSDHDDAFARLGDAADRFGREDIRYIVTRGAEGTAPESASVLIPYAGQMVMRSGWTEDDVYLAMDAGPFGRGHQHEDKLTLDLWAYGEELIVDPGRYTYAPGPWRTYFVSTASHSTVLVDDAGQSRRGDKATWVADQPEPLRWQSTALLDYGVGVYDSGYVDALDVVHIRNVLFVKPLRAFLVVDLVFSATGDASPHAVTSQFQFARPGATVDEETLAATLQAPNAGAVVAPLPTEGLTHTAHEGEEDPPAGWVGWDYHLDLKEPATLVRYRREGALPMALPVALASYRGQDTPEVRLTPLEANVDGRPALPHEVTAVALRVGDREFAVVISHLTGTGSLMVEGRAVGSEVAVWDRATGADVASLGVTGALPPGATSQQRLQWGYAAGGGYAYEARFEGEVAIPRAKPGVEYVYRVLEITADGATVMESGRWRPDE